MSKIVIEMDLSLEVPDPDDLRALCIALDVYSHNLSDKQQKVGRDNYNYTQSQDMESKLRSLQWSIESSMEQFAAWNAMSEDERWPKPQKENAEIKCVDQADRDIPIGDASGDVVVDQVQPHKS